VAVAETVGLAVAVEDWVNEDAAEGLWLAVAEKDCVEIAVAVIEAVTV